MENFYTLKILILRLFCFPLFTISLFCEAHNTYTFDPRSAATTLQGERYINASIYHVKHHAMNEGMNELLLTFDIKFVIIINDKSTVVVYFYIFYNAKDQ